MGERFLSKVSDDIKKQSWDAVVIGSGLGGMTAAVKLAKEGKKVLLCEQHFLPGGYATSFKRKGYRFEASLHQTPGFAEKHIFNQILKELGVRDRITPIPLQETFLVRSTAGDFSMGPEYIAQLKKAFPSEAVSLDRLDKTVENILRQSCRLFPWSFLPRFLYELLGRIIAPDLCRCSRRTLNEFMADYTANPMLKQLLSILWGYLGLPLNRISALLYILEWGAFMKEGIYYIKGTSQALSNAMMDRIEELGGQVLLRTRVEKILVEQGRVRGVVAREVKKEGAGEQVTFRAPLVVSNANPFHTYLDLVGPENAPADTIRKMRNTEVSASATVLFIGLKCPLEKLTRIKSHSIALDALTPETDMDKTFEDRLVGRFKGADCLADYSAIDPDLAPPGKSALTAIKIDFWNNWANLTEDEYRAKKERETAEILDQIEALIPGFKENVEVAELGTPRTMHRYTSNHLGAFNGFAYTLNRVGMGKGGFDAASPIKGLFFAGAWVGAVSGGYAGSLPNGYQTAQTALRRGCN